MSASTDRRVARLVGRIAEERAARGRPAISHAPRTARSFSVEFFEPPTVQGDEAKLAFVHAPLSPLPSMKGVAKAVRIVEFVGPYENVRYETDTQPTRVSIYLEEAGMVDYAGVATDRTARPTLSETKKPEERELTLVDRLFAGW